MKCTIPEHEWAGMQQNLDVGSVRQLPSHKGLWLYKIFWNIIIHSHHQYTFGHYTHRPQDGLFHRIPMACQIVRAFWPYVAKVCNRMPRAVGNRHIRKQNLRPGSMPNWLDWFQAVIAHQQLQLEEFRSKLDFRILRDLRWKQHMLATVKILLPLRVVFHSTLKAAQHELLNSVVLAWSFKTKKPLCIFNWMIKVKPWYYKSWVIHLLFNTAHQFISRRSWTGCI